MYVELVVNAECGIRRCWETLCYFYRIVFRCRSRVVKGDFLAKVKDESHNRIKPPFSLQSWSSDIIMKRPSPFPDQC